MKERKEESSKTVNKGFTLIELLVVVLIIGILVAIALPQYNKTVIKSRYATLKTLTKGISDAQDEYYLLYGQYAKKFVDLGIDMPSGVINTDTNDEEHVSDQYNYDWGYCAIRQNNSGNTHCLCLNKQTNMVYFINKDTGKRFCFIFGSKKEEDFPLQNEICKSETGQTTKNYASNFGPNLYVRYDY